MPFEQNPPAIVQSIISNEDRIGQLIEEAQSFDNSIKFGIAQCADDMIHRGNALNKAMQLAGKGQLTAVLAKHWKGRISTRTAYRYMKLATEEAKRQMIAEFESHTHKQLDDDENIGDEEQGKPLTAAERTRYIAIISRENPALGHKLRTGKKKLNDLELKAKIPPYTCLDCLRGVFRGGTGRPCPNCQLLKKAKQQKLFEDKEEPDEDDPTKNVKAPDPYAEAKKFVTKTATTITKLTSENPPLYEALKACRLMDHPAGESPRFCALAGVKKVIELIEEGETSMSKIKHAYDLASGGFVPPRFQRGRS